MVDSKENYKFDLGVKGLKELVHYEIRLLRYLLINFFAELSRLYLLIIYCGFGTI